MAMMTPEMQKKYIASQQKRYDDALSSGDKNLATRIVTDLKRFDYKPLKQTVKPVEKITLTPQKMTNEEYNNWYKTNGLFRTPTLTNNNNQSTNKDITSTIVSNEQNSSSGSSVLSENKTPVTSQNGGLNVSYQTNPSGFTYDPSKDIRFAEYFKTPEQFNYDPKSDPMYQTLLQNALTGAKSNAKRAQLNALESLNERGISNSSIAASQLAQIEQDALTGAQSNLESSLLPQLLNQAYQRYSDGLANKRYQGEMLRGLTSDAYNQYLASLDNQRSDRQLNMQEAGLTGLYNGQKTQDALTADRNFALQQAGLTGMYNGKQTLSGKELALKEQQLREEKARNIAQDTEDKKRWWAEYNRSGQQWASQNKLNWAELSQRQKEQVADEAWKEKNYQLDKDAAAWQRDPNNPLNMQREATAEEKGAQDKNEYVATQTAEFIKNIRDNMEDDSLGMSYNNAVRQINDLIIAGVYTKEDGTKILNALKAAGLEPKEKSKTNTYKPSVTGSNMGSIFR